jgi:uncharacterized protein (DUF58 family)
LLLILGVLVAALNTGNNLLYLLLALLLALLVVQNILAEWHFRGLSVERRLPLEMFAGEGALGALVVCNHRKALSAFSLIMEEIGGEAVGAVTVVPPGQRIEVPVRFVFERRGPAVLNQVRMLSSFPFGLFVRRRRYTLPADLLVYPSRKAGSVLAEPAEAGFETPDPLRNGGNEDFRGLRAYQAGDPLRKIHWPSSAKTGRLQVVERSLARSEAVVVTVTGGKGLENQLSRACGQADRHFHRGHAVGLKGPGVTLLPNLGPEHRRRLLSSLALMSPVE